MQVGNSVKYKVRDLTGRFLKETLDDDVDTLCDYSVSNFVWISTHNPISSLIIISFLNIKSKIRNKL